MNSLELRRDQKRSLRVSSGLPSLRKPLIFSNSFSLGLRARHRTYNSSTTSSGFFVFRSVFTTLPSLIFSLVVLPLSKCNACERLGSVFTSHEQTLSRVARPNVVRK